MIKKKGSKWIIVSEGAGRTLGEFKTKKEAKKRLRQIAYFKLKSKHKRR